MWISRQRQRRVTRSGQLSGSGRRERERFYYNLLLINQQEPNGPNKKSFDFFLVSKILGFDLHFVFVLSLNCDDSRMKEGVVKTFGFDV
jgi:hypothetical protein